MAEKTQTPTQKLEREYVIPLRREWRKKANYKRARKAVQAIKEFIAKHMKVPDRDTSKVKIDIYINNEVWFRGKTKPPAKIKVKAIKEGDIIKVTLADIPPHVKFLQAKHKKLHKESEKPKEKEEKPEDQETKKEDAEKKEAEKEKAQAATESKAQIAETKIKEQKHTSKVKEPTFHRMALKK